MRRRDLLRAIQETQARRKREALNRKDEYIWPTCMTCGCKNGIFSVNMEDAGPNDVEVRVKCYHKPWTQASDSDPVFEDFAKIHVPFGHGSAEREEHLKWAMQSLSWFDPTRPSK